MIKKIITPIICLLFPFIVLANSQHANYLSTCPTTPSVWYKGKKPEIYHSNNLRKKNGSADFASGEYINIAGQLRDSNCVPIPGAIVSIWHNDANGLPPEKTTDQFFTGSGTTITDNRGNFAFFTIKPSKSDNLPQHVNFSIEHKDFEYFETQMIFQDPANESSTSDKLLTPIYRGFDNNTKSELFDFNISIPGTIKYKQL